VKMGTWQKNGRGIKREEERRTSLLLVYPGRLGGVVRSGCRR
jgi:hypothetical protein